MSDAIYYFSVSGNSLVVARDLAGRMNGRLIPIPSVVDQESIDIDCPVNNITMVNGKSVWQHSCETCFACFQWCPQGAIRGEIVEYEKRYHHPDVRLADMLRRDRPAQL